jgi:small GTP-binding protein
MAAEKKLKAKVIIIGNAETGKSSLIKRKLGHVFSEEYDPSIVAKTYPDLQEINLWHLSGLERFRSTAISYIKNADVSVLVFDVTKKKSFYDIPYWINLTSMLASNAQCILVGTKIDLADKREVTKEEALAFAKASDNIQYYEVSAKTGENIETLFQAIIDASKQPEIKLADSDRALQLGPGSLSHFHQQEPRQIRTPSDQGATCSLSPNPCSIQ